MFWAVTTETSRQPRNLFRIDIDGNEIRSGLLPFPRYRSEAREAAAPRVSKDGKPLPSQGDFDLFGRAVAAVRGIPGAHQALLRLGEQLDYEFGIRERRT